MRKGQREKVKKQKNEELNGRGRNLMTNLKHPNPKSEWNLARIITEQCLHNHRHVNNQHAGSNQIVD